MNPISRHYGVSGLLDRILGALRESGKDISHLSPADLAPVDEFHIRGREATLELAALAEPRAGWQVIDVGSGLGGSARFLASEFGCYITGVDLTREYCETAEALSKLVGLDGRTEFRCASALEMPFEDAAFDLAWSQHMQMNVADKQALCREIARVLRPGARFVFHDVLAGPDGEPHFPVPWAGSPELSFLIAPDELRALLGDCGFQALSWRDTTAISREWFLAGIERQRSGGVPPLGIHLLMGDSARQRLENVARNLSERRVSVFQGSFERL
jgi:SAM-dependent methyltransferase